jgi:protein SCO1/2
MQVFNNSRRVLLAAAAAVPLALVLAGCDNKSQVPKARAIEFLGTDITGSDVGQGLSMPDTQGKLHTLADFKGKVTVFFFGYTQCPDVCPTAMAQLAQTLQALGKDAAKVQVVMVSVDPDRDTPNVLEHYVKAFDPSFMGLTGTPDQLAAAARSFKAYYAKVPGTRPGQYSMDHASSFYVFDTNAEPRVLISGAATAADIADDIKKLL